MTQLQLHPTAVTPTRLIDRPLAVMGRHERLASHITDETTSSIYPNLKGQCQFQFGTGAVGDPPTVLLKNHGVFTGGTDGKKATKAAVMVEYVAKTVCLAMQIGQPDELTPKTLPNYTINTQCLRPIDKCNFVYYNLCCTIYRFWPV